MDNKDNKLSKPKTIQKKRNLAKQIEKKGTKTLILIFGLIGHPSSDISVLYINTNIVILALYLWQILLKFQEEKKRLMTILHISYKKMLCSLLSQLLWLKSNIIQNLGF